MVENVPKCFRRSLYWARDLAMEVLADCLSPNVVYTAKHEVAQHLEWLFIMAARSKRPQLFPCRNLSNSRRHPSLISPLVPGSRLRSRAVR
jgi:hypothetical protein